MNRFNCMPAARHLLWRACLPVLLIGSLLWSGLPTPAPMAQAAPLAQREELPFDKIISAWTSDADDMTADLAWSDVNNDGRLDLAVASRDRSPQNNEAPLRLYYNQGDTLPAIPDWTSPVKSNSRDLAWGDVDNDGYRDLAVMNFVRGNATQVNQLYRNDSGELHAVEQWQPNPQRSNSAAWGDMDGDGDLDLAVGNEGPPNPEYGELDFQYNRVYRNDGNGRLSDTPVWEAKIPSRTASVAWGDVDNDRDLDLVVGNFNDDNPGDEPALVYFNINGMLQTRPGWQVQDPRAVGDPTNNVLLGDMDGDGDLDLVVGNWSRPVRVYYNTGSGLETSPGWSSPQYEDASSVALGDADGDGDLDIAVGGYRQPNRIYRNDSSPTNHSFSLGWTGLEREETTQMAWGDIDGDGDLDLAAGIRNGHSRVYRNEINRLILQPASSVAGMESAKQVAWGDMDGDGDLDLATANDTHPTQVYRNRGDGLEPFWSAPDSASTTSVAWGDMDDDGDLDLAVGNSGQPNRVYRNDGGTLSTKLLWEAPLVQRTTSLAWGDVDSDGDLDLAVGNSGQPNRVYRNDGRRNDGDMVSTELLWDAPLVQRTTSLAWGDMDGDGDLDLAVGNSYAKASIAADDRGHNRVYENLRGNLSNTPVWESSRVEYTTSLAWGDVNGDGGLDLAVGNHSFHTEVYYNDNAGGGGLFKPDPWKSQWANQSQSVAWGDADGDGDLDLAVGSGREPDDLYRNEGGQLRHKPVWSSSLWDGQTQVSWGDLDGDGDLDLLGSKALYLNHSRVRASSPQPLISGLRPLGRSAQASFYAVAKIWSERTLTFGYTLSHPSSQPVQRVFAEYSLDGGDNWQPAQAISDTSTITLTTSPTGEAHTYVWDVLGSGVMGQSDNVVVRLTAVPQLTQWPNPEPSLYGSSSATTLPLRVRGRQVQVLLKGEPKPNALVYRQPKDGSAEGLPLQDRKGGAFRTNDQGFLQGRAQMYRGDRLMAMLPVTPTHNMAIYHNMTLYHTNVQPRNPAFTPVTEENVQTLIVSPERPLILVDLQVSLEWDAHTDNDYLVDLKDDLEAASRHLYDFTDGQMALGKVNVWQGADHWATADVVIHSNNKLRPYAVQGGHVVTSTKDYTYTGIIYEPGQVHMGIAWDRFGNPSLNKGEDWALALAHELGHYLLFLDDTYLGLSDNDLLIPVDTCLGSAMGDVYNSTNTEFIGQQATWDAGCRQTLTQQLLHGNQEHMNEWTIINRWYPELRPAEDAAYEGPAAPLMDLTTVIINPPSVPTPDGELRADPRVSLRSADAHNNSTETRAVLLRELKQKKYAIDLGGLESGQAVRATGARVGDRLCVFDRLYAQHNCLKFTEDNIDRDITMNLYYDPNWQPVVRLSPEAGGKMTLEVSRIEANLAIFATLYPEYGEAPPEQRLDPDPDNKGVYRGTFDLSDRQTNQLSGAALSGMIQVWSPKQRPSHCAPTDPSPACNPRRDVVVPYSIGGNPGYTRTGGGYTRTGGAPTTGGGRTVPWRGVGSSGLASSAPVVSPDGQMIFFTREPEPFKVGEFYTIQAMAGLPNLPVGKQVIGQSNRLVSYPANLYVTGSISFQYNDDDLPNRSPKYKESLRIHYWDGFSWSVLLTQHSDKYGMASAKSAGPGVYALLGDTTIPLIERIAPERAISGFTTTLTITGKSLLQPVKVELVSATSSITLTPTMLPVGRMKVTVPDSLPAGEYTVKVTNGDKGQGVAPKPFVLVEQTVGCFADQFTSGDSQWTRTGNWATTLLPSPRRESVMSDSPDGSYFQSPWPNASRVTTITTAKAFDLSGCPEPQLYFRHDYVLAKGKDSIDVGQVQISKDDGASWTTLVAYSGSRRTSGAQLRASAVQEWVDPLWEHVWIDLSDYRGPVKLRFRLDVDDLGADRGWVIDEVSVASRRWPTPFDIHLPLMSQIPVGRSSQLDSGR